jgi:hypothetical protein
MVAFVSISHVLIVIKNRSINKELGHGGLEDSRKAVQELSMQRSLSAINRIQLKAKTSAEGPFSSYGDHHSNLSTCILEFRPLFQTHHLRPSAYTQCRMTLIILGDWGIHQCL